jgi:hypothetical protein
MSPFWDNVLAFLVAIPIVIPVAMLMDLRAEAKLKREERRRIQRLETDTVRFIQRQVADGQRDILGLVEERSRRP